MPRAGHRRGVHQRVVILVLLASGLHAGELPGHWTGDYPPCDRHGDALNREHMDLGVRFSTSSRERAVEFRRALNFWASILDMDWHPEESRACAIAIIDGHAGLFKPGEVARAQFPWAGSFQGWVAFNPKMSLPRSDLFLTAVHELGHVLGLLHSDNVSSVMYFIRLNGPFVLDHADLEALATRHKLRVAAVPESLSLPQPYITGRQHDTALSAGLRR